MNTTVFLWENFVFLSSQWTLVSALKYMFGICKAGNYTVLRNWVYLFQMTVAYFNEQCIIAEMPRGA